MTKRWRENVDVAVKLVAVCGALFGVFKYFDDAESSRALARRQAAVSYVEQYDGVELRNHRQKLFEFWLRNADAVAYFKESGISDEDYRSFVLAAFQQDSAPRDLLNAVYALASFYDQAALCKETHICDAKIVDSHFCKGAKEFSASYEPVIDQLGRSSGASDFAGGARALGRSC